MGKKFIVIVVIAGIISIVGIYYLSRQGSDDLLSRVGAPCKIPQDAYVNTYGQSLMGTDEAKNSVDFEIFIPAYIPGDLKQVCPIESEVVQAGYRGSKRQFLSSGS